MFKELLEHLLTTPIEDLMKIQKPEAERKDADDYMVGLYNGLSIAKSAIDGSEADLKNCKENRFEVAYTLPGKEREFEDFTQKSKAEKFAKEVIAKGATKVFIDEYDNDDDLVNYKHLKENL